MKTPLLQEGRCSQTLAAFLSGLHNSALTICRYGPSEVVKQRTLFVALFFSPVSVVLTSQSYTKLSEIHFAKVRLFSKQQELLSLSKPPRLVSKYGYMKYLPPCERVYAEGLYLRTGSLKPVRLIVCCLESLLLTASNVCENHLSSLVPWTANDLSNRSLAKIDRLNTVQASTDPIILITIAR